MGVSEDEWQRLLMAAKDASARAYCPYSHFRVGAAVLGDDRIIVGCNVENAAYGLTLCAERNALFGAIAQGARRIIAVLIFTPTDEPAPPCGACRQVLIELARDAEVRCVCTGPRVLSTSVAELLPHAFGPAMLVN